MEHKDSVDEPMLPGECVEGSFLLLFCHERHTPEEAALKEPRSRTGGGDWLSPSIRPCRYFALPNLQA